jgi:hypothetical protein
VSAAVEITSLQGPLADGVLAQLADVLVDCVEGGASVSFMSPFSRQQALAFFRKVAGSVVSGDTVLLAARLDGRIVGTVQLGLDTPPNQPRRYQEAPGASLFSRPRRWRRLDGAGGGRGQASRPLAFGARYRAG